MKKMKIKMSKDDKNIIIKALVEKRNKQIRENKPAEPVNELLIKLMEKN